MRSVRPVYLRSPTSLASGRPARPRDPKTGLEVTYSALAGQVSRYCAGMAACGQSAHPPIRRGRVYNFRATEDDIAFPSLYYKVLDTHLEKLVFFENGRVQAFCCGFSTILGNAAHSVQRAANCRSDILGGVHMAALSFCAAIRHPFRRDSSRLLNSCRSRVSGQCLLLRSVPSRYPAPAHIRYMAQVSLGLAAYRDIVRFPAQELLDCRRNLSVRNKIKSGTGCVLTNARQSAEAASSLIAHAILNSCNIAPLQGVTT